MYGADQFDILLGTQVGVFTQHDIDGLVFGGEFGNS